MNGSLGDLMIAAVVFLIIGAGSGILTGLLKHREVERKARNERAKFWGLIPTLARTLATEPGSGRATADWERILIGFYTAGFSLNETQRVIDVARGAFPEPGRFDFEDFLARKNAWSIRTFGPGDARDRVAGLSDHIRKELDEIQAEPMDLEEWIDVTFLALDGAFRAGGDPARICDALEAKLMKNKGRCWPNWRTVPAGKAIEHERGTLADVFDREFRKGQIDGIVVRPTPTPKS